MCAFNFQKKMELIDRYFVQYIMKKGIVPLTTALEYCKTISKGKINSLVHLKTLIICINREISKQFFKIVLNTCEVTNQEYVIWICSKNDDISRLQLSFNELELEYFHAIMQEIVSSESHRLTFIAVINITSTLTANFSRENGQKVLTKWIKIGYFVKYGDHIYLGPRIIFEFASYLKRHCPNSVCSLCSELVFVARVCNSCYKLFHSHCLTKFLSNHDSCPACHSRWSEDVPPSEILEPAPMDNSTDSDESEDSPVASPQRNRRIIDDEEAGPSHSKISRNR